MAATDDFREAIKAGELLEALKTALSESIELEITTWISLADPYSANPDEQPEAQPGYRMHSRINIVDGEIDTEVGSHFVGNGPFTELREFHINQIRSSRQIIKRNLNSIQKLFGLWAEMQQQEFETVVTHLESVAAQDTENSSSSLEEVAEVEWEVEVPPVAETVEESIQEKGDRHPETSLPPSEELEDDFFDSFDTQPTETKPQPPSDPLDDIFGENEPESQSESQKQTDLSLETIAAAAGFTAAAVAITSSAEASEPEDPLAPEPPNEESNLLDIESEEPLDDEEQEIMSAFDATYSDSVVSDLETTEEIIDAGAIEEPPLIPIEDSPEIPELNTNLSTPNLDSSESETDSSFSSFDPEEDEIMAAFDSDIDTQELSTETNDTVEESANLTNSELETFPVIDVVSSEMESADLPISEVSEITASNDQDFIGILDADVEGADSSSNLGLTDLQESSVESSEPPEESLPNFEFSDEDNIMAEFDAQYGASIEIPTESADKTPSEESLEEAILEEIVTESHDQEQEEPFPTSEEVSIEKEELVETEELSENPALEDFLETEELAEMEEDPFASLETEQLWETEETSESSALEESLETEELVETEEDPFASSETEQLWETEKLSETPVLEESLEVEELVATEDDSFASSETEELLETLPLEESLEEELVEIEEDPFASSETEELWETEETSEASLLEESLEEELVEMEEDPFASSETEELWETEETLEPPALEESL
ncbi:MAG: hypothetical protein J7540_21760, partial [Roseofilum sp. SID2]|uniref:hypothetical protein n=1 Tax=Roseofilum sp. SID2 TaxID=2821498 RepID=UPI001B2A48A7